MASIIPTAWGQNRDSGIVSRGREHASGAGRSDGGHVGTSRSGSTACLENFGAPVPPNGYRWWYCDALSDDGAYGLAIIGFVGSVFSPYYKTARRKGPADPEQFCAINVGLYGRSGHYWTMTERGRRDLLRSDAHFSLGPSSMSWEHGTLVIRIDEIAVPWPSRVHGEIRVRPDIIVTEDIPLDTDARHLWRPVAPLARVSARFDHPGLSWTGTGYHDMNWGHRPLEDDFRSWIWSRAAMKNSAHIVYDRVMRDGSQSGFTLRIAHDGTLHSLPMPAPHDLGKAFWRMPRPARSDAPMSNLRSLEDAPFYTRSLYDTVIDGEPVRAFHESLSLDRFTHPIVQAMLPFKMPRRA